MDVSLTAHHHPFSSTSPFHQAHDCIHNDGLGPCTRLRTGAITKYSRSLHKTHIHRIIDDEVARRCAQKFTCLCESTLLVCVRVLKKSEARMRAKNRFSNCAHLRALSGCSRRDRLCSLGLVLFLSHTHAHEAPHRVPCVHRLHAAGRNPLSLSVMRSHQCAIQ